MTMESGIRKLIVLEETILNEGGGSAVRPVCRVAGVGVFTNPCSGRFVSDVAMHHLELKFRDSKYLESGDGFPLSRE